MRFNACIRTALSLLLILLCFALPCASADEAPVASASVTPQDFVAPAEAVLSVTITNKSASPLTDIRISTDANTKGEQFKSIEPGKSGYFELRVSITEKTLSAGKLTAYITLKCEGKTRKLTANAPVYRVSALPEVVFSCHIPRSAAYEGEPVSAEYYMKNTGGVGILNAVIEDTAFSFVSAPFDLLPGEEKLVPCVSILSKSVTSAPRVSYLSQESGTRYVSYAGSSAVTIASDAIEFSAAPENAYLPAGERATLTVSVRNNGSLRYTDLRLTEPVLGEIIDFPSVLDAHQHITHTLETPALSADTFFQFTLSLQEAGGSILTLSADNTAVAVLSAQPHGPEFTVSANPAGDAPFTFTLRGASAALSNVRLLEKDLGEIKVFSHLSANDTITYSPLIPVNREDEYVFTLEWSQDGQTHTIMSSPVHALLDTGIKDATGVSQHANYAFFAIVHATGLSDIILYGSIIFIVLLISLTVGLRVLKKRRLKRDIQETLGRTNKFAPVRPRDAEKEK